MIRILFKDERDAGRFLTKCRQRGLDARPEERRPVGTVKRVGPEPAVWLDAHPGRRHIGVAANRKATNAAAWKIHSGQRRGFENHEYEARTIRENGEWHVYARHLKRSRTGRKNGTPDEGTMTSLF